jgi:hypothetical protein
MSSDILAIQIIEKLRQGQPPRRGVDLYSVGHSKLINGVKTFHLDYLSDRGIIRFVSGSWGSGKTHFFRLLRELSFKDECLVSNVELNVSDAALNKFEKVFYSIIRKIESSKYFEETDLEEAAPFGRVILEALIFLSRGNRDNIKNLSHEDYTTANNKLMADKSIDIDFKKMIQKYWETFLPDVDDEAIIDQTRGEILQWFSGEGTIGSYRKRFGVNKIVSKDNSKLMLQSLAAFIRISGYRGLVILFDEAERAYSIMRKSALRDAHNNLLSLINNIESLPGLFLIYATTPDFYDDPKHGIVIYGALSGRIGKPEERTPRALDTIWNLDAIEMNIDYYNEAALKIKNIYQNAYPDSKSKIPKDEDINKFVKEIFELHPAFSGVRFWRVLVTTLIRYFDDCFEGDVKKPEDIYDDIMEGLREE